MQRQIKVETRRQCMRSTSDSQWRHWAVCVVWKGFTHFHTHSSTYTHIHIHLHNTSSSSSSISGSGTEQERKGAFYFLFFSFFILWERSPRCSFLLLRSFPQFNRCRIVFLTHFISFFFLCVWSTVSSLHDRAVLHRVPSLPGLKKSPILSPLVLFSHTLDDIFTLSVCLISGGLVLAGGGTRRHDAGGFDEVLGSSPAHPPPPPPVSPAAEPTCRLSACSHLDSASWFQPELSKVSAMPYLLFCSWRASLCTIWRTVCCTGGYLNPGWMDGWMAWTPTITLHAGWHASSPAAARTYGCTDGARNAS